MAEPMIEQKAAVGRAAAALVQNKMRVGLGTGSTSRHFIEALSNRIKEEGLQIQAIATSRDSQRLAESLAIPLRDPEEMCQLDLVVDGADQVEEKSHALIKGAGGALLREKIVAAMAQRYLIIIDETKLRKSLGEVSLPIEVLPFGRAATFLHLSELGWPCHWRLTGEGALYRTDNGNYIAELSLGRGSGSWLKLEQKLKAIPGVVETGFFLAFRPDLLLGQPSGEVEFLPYASTH